MAFHRRTTALKRGFTLAEVLVTLAIIAVMAAVLLPALNSQLSKGDTGRLASDLTNIQTAAQAFVSDVHRFPASTAELTTAITSGSADLLTVTIPATLVAKWKGPYLAKDAVANTAGGVISPTFTSVAGANSVNYLTVSVTGISVSDFADIENILDEGTSSSTSSSLGNIRYTGTTLTFLAIPIQ
jgi:prepilin-type N-terminal cleavage/methylation domain-containing protein